MQRRLAAILAADVAGYTRLMGSDEAGTASRIMALRSALLEPLIAQHRGRMVKVMGDGFLVEFASVVDALTCGLSWQAAVAKNQAQMSEDKRIVFRIGVNLGDVLVEDGDLLGDGVNIASRLEALAEPGGIRLSEDAFRQVRGKVDAIFEDQGAQTLKNIAEPIRVYRVLSGKAAPQPGASVAKTQSLAEKPSVAVLPFTNMSGDPEQEFFADGISEDIITELSKFRSIFVIARNSSFTFKGQALDVKDVSRKLGVRYLVEGSVRRAGNRVRITAQLIDASEDRHIWAERYDRDLSDIFAIQDEVTLAIVTAIEPQLAVSERKRALRKPPESLDAWENYQRGLWHLFQYQIESMPPAIDFFSRAIALEPTFASVHAGVSYACYCNIIIGGSKDHDADVAKAIDMAKLATKLDESDLFAWIALSRAKIVSGAPDEALAAADRAVALAPNSALAQFGRAHALWHEGRPSEALAAHEIVLRLSPNDPLRNRYLASQAIALVMAGEFEKAVQISLQSQKEAGAAIFCHLAEVSALGNLGRLDEARDAIERAREKMPTFSLAFVQEAFPVADERCRALFFGGLQKAGVPAV